MNELPAGYEAAKMSEIERVCQMMREIPAVQVAIEEHRLMVLTCPLGHKITTVEL